MIRRMVRKDLPRAEELEKECFSDAWSMTLLSAGLQNENEAYFAAEKDGRVCGYACCLLAGQEAEVERVAVEKTYRGRGLGRKLTEALLERAALGGAERVFLEVRAGNAPAIAMYRGLGFFQVGKRPVYYKDPAEDALVMEKVLLASEPV